jgi:WD40 repeat protein/DNA-binding SARP family transcriptional activator
MGLLRLSVLGPPEVYHDERRLSFGLRKAESLLLYLAVEGGLHSRSKLAALLWPDSEPSTARTALRNVLALLRRLLADGEASGHRHLLQEPERLGLNPQAPLERDLDLVQRAWQAAQRLAAATSEEQRAALVTQVQHALSLVRGPFLDGFWLREETAFDQWHEQLEQQWQVRVQFLLERLSAWQEEGFELEAAKATLTRWLALDPLSEEAARRVMRVHLAQGDPSAAGRVYASLRARLAQEVRLKPSAETVALFERIRTSQARQGGAAVRPAPTVESRRSGELVAPLIGRGAAFRQLVGRYQQAQQGQPQAVLLLGEAGSGKTRLAGEFVAWTWTQGVEVLRGNAFELGGRLPYQPLAEALRARLEAENAPEDLLEDLWLAELSRLVPELRLRYPDLPAPIQDELSGKLRLFEAVARLVQVLAQRAPLVLLLEDLQWIDGASLDLLRYLGHGWKGQNRRVLVLLTVRSDGGELHPELAALGRDLPLSRLPLPPLSQAETVELLEALVTEEEHAPGRPSPVGASAALERPLVTLGTLLFACTGGQPLSLLETLKLLRERRLLVPRLSAGGVLRLALTEELVAALAREEIRAPGKADHQQVLLEETWLASLLGRTPPGMTLLPPEAQEAARAAELRAAQPTPAPKLDWGEAPDVYSFYGREAELATLARWVIEERCRVVCMLGMGGVGKSALAVTLMRQATPHFEAVLWRSVRDVPSCEELVADCITFFSETPPAEFPSSLEQRISRLLARLQANRCLLVLDNLESLLQSGDPEGGYLPGYEGYGRLIGRLGEAAHQSCVLLTSREKPIEMEPLEGSRSPVHSLRLSGLDEQTARVLLADKGLSGTPAAWQRLVASYAGNPLALKIVGQAISDLFGGDLDRFLEEGELIFNGVRPVLRQQMGRLTLLEHLLLTWLAVLREWTPLDTLMQVLHPRALRTQVLEALEALSRRSLLERGQQASFSLQSVVMEFLTDALGERLAEEIVLGDPQHLRRVALSQAQATDYVRQTQVRLLIHPLLERLRAELGADGLVEQHLLGLLAQFRAEDATAQGYGPANVLSLLKDLRGHLRGLDLSRLTIRGAYLQGIELQDASLAGARLCECVLTQTFDGIIAVAISSSGQYWAAGSRRGEVRVWRVGREGGQTLHLAWPAHTDLVVNLAFSPDERTLASGSFDGSVKLWDLESGALLWSGWQSKVISWLALSPDGGLLASGTVDGTVRLWEAQLGTPLQDLPHPGSAISLAWSPHGSLLATGDAASTIRLWERQGEDRSGPTRCVQTFEAHSSRVHGLAFAPDGRRLASANYDSTVKLWEVVEARIPGLRQTLVGHTEPVQCLAWSPDGTTLASSSFDHTIRLWDGKLGRSRAMLQGHSTVVHGLAFTPDSRHLLSGSEDGTLRLWEVERAQCVRILQGYTASLFDVAWSPDGARLASGGTDNVVTLWEVERGAALKLLRGHRWLVQGVAWSPDGSLLASSGWDNAIRLWEPTTGTCVQILRDRDHPDTLFNGLAWSPDGERLASGTIQRGVLVWEVAAGSPQWVNRSQATWVWVRRVAWSPDGTRIVGAGDDGHLYLWDASDGRLLQRLAGHHGTIMSVAWSPDSSRLASAGSGEVRVWEMQSEQVVQALAPHPGVAATVVWEPNGEQLITGGSDGRLRWWDLHSGECVQVQQAHQGTVHALKVSPDGRRLASCGDDGAIRLWELEGGEPLHTLRRDRPYERLNITGIQGLTGAEIATLRALGAVGDAAVESL